MALLLIDENLSGGIGISPHSAPDDHSISEAKARQLLRSILPENEWREFEGKGVIQCSGKRGLYVISPFAQTEIRDAVAGRSIAYACLQLSITAPNYDRMIAEYLLIRNDEDFYWKTANMSLRRCGNEFGIAALFLVAFNLALFVNLLLDVGKY
jgi:hypothetical protein